jgi:hypothetical protein
MGSKAATSRAEAGVHLFSKFRNVRLNPETALANRVERPQAMGTSPLARGAITPPTQALRLGGNPPGFSAQK